MPRAKALPEYEHPPHIPTELRSTDPEWVLLRIDGLSYAVRPAAARRFREELRRAAKVADRIPIG